MHRHYVIDHSAVASDIIDGEAIILHHRSGDYFSADGTGAVIWEWLGAEKSREAMLAAFMAGFPASRDTIEESVDAFLADLLDHALILEVGPNAAMANGADHEAAPTDPALTGELAQFNGRYSPPVLHTYTDMREVLLVDPIHEVEEASGWPVPKHPGTK